MDKLVSKALFPIFCVAHGVVWHTCKFHENDGLCVQLFGLPWDGNHHPSADAEQKPRSIFHRLFSFIGSDKEHEQLELEILERQQHYRLELVREVNLALAILAAFASVSKSDIVRTQMLLVESVVFGVAAYDAFKMADGFNLVVPMLLLTLMALIGLVIQVGREHDTGKQLFQGLDKARGVESFSETPVEETVVETTREPFETLPAEVQELMAKSAEEVPSSDKLSLFIDESIVTATAIKPDKASTVGITIKKIPSDGRTIISRLSATGLFANSPLKVGQTILSVNGTPATEFETAKDVTAIIKEAKEVTIVATKSLRIEVVKPSKDSRVGISFSKSKREGSLAIYKINPDSLFQGSGLEVGMRVVAMNGKPCPSKLKDAGDVVKETDGVLVMIAVMDDEKETASSAKEPLPIVTKAASKVDAPPESAPTRPGVGLTKGEF